MTSQLFVQLSLLIASLDAFGEETAHAARLAASVAMPAGVDVGLVEGAQRAIRGWQVVAERAVDLGRATRMRQIEHSRGLQLPCWQHPLLDTTDVAISLLAAGVAHAADTACVLLALTAYVHTRG